MFAKTTYELVADASQTTVVLAPSFVTALAGLGVSPGGLDAGNLIVSGGVATAVFGIPTGRFDSSNLRLQFVHTGGLTLRAGSTFVILSDFIIESLAAGPRLTGLVRVNDTIVGRIPLFTLTLAGAPEVKSFDSTTDAGTAGTINIKASLRLTDAAATALNGVFGGRPFAKDIAIGDGTVRGIYLDDVR